MSLPQPPTVPRCYRHPDREGGRSCTRCGKPACSDCLVQAAIGSHCLECAKAARPDVKSRAKLASSRVLAPVTFVFIGLNLLVFLWTALGGGEALLFGGNDRTSDLGISKYVLQGVLHTSGGGLIADSHEWYRIITSGFIHFGILHLAMNMWSLYILGPILERRLGSVRFALLYMASLIGGSAGVVLLQPGSLGISGGASGAIFGLLAALVVSLWLQGVNPFTSNIGQVFMLNIFITVMGRSYISVGGHAGGGDREWRDSRHARAGRDLGLDRARGGGVGPRRPRADHGGRGHQPCGRNLPDTHAGRPRAVGLIRGCGPPMRLCRIVDRRRAGTGS